MNDGTINARRRCINLKASPDPPIAPPLGPIEGGTRGAPAAVGR